MKEDVGLKGKWILIFILLLNQAYGQAVSTVAGVAGATGSVNGQGTAARFNNPHGIAADRVGNTYVADRMNHCIRKVDENGIVTTIAGSGTIGGTDGPGATATFYEPWAVDCDSAGNIYVADTRNYKIRKITPSGDVTTIAGQGTFGTTNGPALLARFGFPSGICVTPDGNTIYVADHNTHVIRVIENGVVSNLAGMAYIAGYDDGGPTTATFNHPYGITLDNAGNILVADEWNNIIRRITPAGVVTTVAGTGQNGSADGQATAASFNYPWDVAVDNNNHIYIADGLNHTIRKLEAGTNQVSTYAGTTGVTGASDGLGSAASFNSATGITYNKLANALFVADAFNNLIRKIAAVSSVQISLSAPLTTVCHGDSISIAAVPSGLSNYIFYDGLNVVGSSATNTVKLQPLQPGVHSITCTATDPGGLTAFSNSVTVTVRQPYVPQITYSTLSFCNGDSVMLTAESGNGYLWSDGRTTQSIYINSSVPVSVTVTSSATGCKGMSSPIAGNVMSGPPAFITANGSTTVCPGDSVLLTASTGSSWLWSTGAVTQQIYATEAGSYSVTVYDASGCRNTSPGQQVSYYTGSQATISPAGPIVLIAGDSITLTSGPAGSYLWSNGSAQQSITVNTAGTYILQITSANGCVSSDTVSVDVITLQQMISAHSSLTFCQGGSVTLESFFSQGNQWYYNGSPIPGETGKQYQAGASGYYQVAALQNSTWIFSDSLVVDVLPAPPPASVTDVSICEGEAVLLTAGADPGTSVSWYDESDNYLSGGNAYQTPSLYNNTVYYVEVTGTNGCKSNPAALQVYSNPKAKADFIYTSEGSPGSYTVTLTNTSTNALLFTWVLVDTVSQVVSSSVNASFQFEKAGTYYFMLIANNAFGCIDSTTRKVIVGANEDWFIPNTFTPNNDGKNDIFRVRGIEVVTKQMSIYDQWGKLIYQDGIDATWDGTSGGKVVQNGTYLYRILFTSKDKEQNISGTVSVIK